MSSSPSIPNLLSLRGGARSSRGRGRGTNRGRGGGSSPHAPSAAHDRTIQGTDDDAAVSRLSAVSLGYLEDPFAQSFVESTPGPTPRRMPIINRGTYTRTYALDSLISSFLSRDADTATGTLTPSRPETPTKDEAAQSGPTTPSKPQRQIVSLGAGTDTRILRLIRQRPCQDLIYHELDFPAIMDKKYRSFQKPSLRSVIGTPEPGNENDRSWSARPPTGGLYYGHGLDLRNFSDGDVDSLAGLDPTLPTLLLSECCLCYLEVAAAQKVLSWFAERIPGLATVIYEPVKPDDAFGRVMTANLAARGIRMPTLEHYPAPADQQTRLREVGLGHAYSLTVDQIWRNWVSVEEKERVDALEGLDEVEEWQLLADHYVVAWAWRGDERLLWDGRTG